jgi:hypothetical protein
MRTVLLLLIALLLVGCKKGYDQVAMGRLTAPEQKIVGRYKMKTEFNRGTGQGAAELQQLFDLLQALDQGAETYLECFPEKKFTMTVGERPVTGEWSLTEGMLRLKILKVGEQKPEDISRSQLKSRGVSGWAMSPAQRDEFLKTYGAALALEQAEGMATMRAGTDGTLYAAAPQDSIFGSLVSYFEKVKE